MMILIKEVKMNNMMWKDYFMNIINNHVNLAVLLICFSLSILFFYLFKKSQKINNRILSLYSVIAFLIVPFIFAAFNWHWQSLISILDCKPQQIMILIPASILGSFSFGFFGVPSIYKKLNSSAKITSKSILDFIKIESKKLKINTPRTYLIKTVKPLAHTITSISSSIFISVGMFELLNKKEIEAVLLHELYHIKQKNSFSKFSVFFLKIITPAPSFTSLINQLDKEERNADLYACQIQKTKKNILSAKIKINNFLKLY